MNHDYTQPEDPMLAAYRQSRIEAQERRGPGRPRLFDPDTANKRRKEKAIRQSLMYQRALAAFRVRYPDEYGVLCQTIKDEIAAERGLLPGDKE